MDIVDKATRSRMMSGIGPANTRPELEVRRYLHATGMRFLIHDARLPGKPDIVLPKYRVAVMVHGCFWHRHPGCRFATTPTTNVDFWRAKFDENVKRDKDRTGQLRRMGWHPIVVWECEVGGGLALDRLFWRIVDTNQPSLI